MAEKVGAIYYELDLDDKKFKKGTKGASGALGGLKKRFKAAEMGSKMLMASMVGLTAGLVVFGKKSVDAYNVQARAEAKLIQLHKENTGATDAQVKSLMDLASETQNYGVIGDESIINGQAQLATFKLSTDAISKLTPAMTDMVAQQKGVNATGEDFVNVGNLIGKVMEGNVGALGRYGVSFDENSEKILKNGTESEKAAELAKVLAANYGGVNKALRDTPEGKIQAIKNRFGDLQEQLGGLIIKAMDPLINAFDTITGKIEEAGGFMEFLKLQVDGNETKIAVMAGAIVGALVPAFVALGASIWAALAPLLPFLAVGAAIGFIVNEVVSRMGGWEVVMGKVTAAAEKLGNPIEKLKEVFDKLKQKFEEIGNSPAVQKFIDLVKGSLTKIMENLRKSFDKIKPKLDELMIKLGELWVAIEPIVKVFMQVVAVIHAVLIVAILKFIEVLALVLGPIISMTLTWIGYIIDIITILANVFTQIVVPAVTLAIQTISGVISWLWNSIISPIFNLIVSIVTWAVDNIIVPAINRFIAIVQMIGTVLSFIWTSIISPTISFIWNLIKSTFETIWGFLQPWLHKAKVGFQVIWAAIKEKIITPIKEAYASLKTKAGEMYDKVKEKFNEIKEYLEGLRDKIKSAITKPFTDAKEKVSEIAGGIKESLSKLDPTKRFSPSIADKVRMGTDQILKTYDNMYNRLDNMSATGRIGLEGVATGLTDGISSTPAEAASISATNGGQGSVKITNEFDMRGVIADEIGLRNLTERITAEQRRIFKAFQGNINIDNQLGS